MEYDDDPKAGEGRVRWGRRASLIRAREAIAQIELSSLEGSEVEAAHAVLDTVRRDLEVALFGWIMPARGKRKPHVSSPDGGRVDRPD